MKAPPFSREHTGDPQLDRMQGQRNELAQLLRLCPFVQGRLVSVSFSGGVYQTVTHKLGVPAACFVIRQNYDAAALGYELSENPSQTGLDQNNQLSLGTSAAVKLDLWFYPRASKQIDPTTRHSP